MQLLFALVPPPGIAAAGCSQSVSGCKLNPKDSLLVCLSVERAKKLGIGRERTTCEVIALGQPHGKGVGCCQTASLVEMTDERVIGFIFSIPPGKLFMLVGKVSVDTTVLHTDMRDCSYALHQVSQFLPFC